MKGYVQVYTGDGKGKTTAAFGLALRAVGAGLKVFIGQFVKGMHYSELDSLKKLSDQITIKQYGQDCFIHNEPEEEDIRIARDGLAEMKAVLSSGEYQLVIMDEANIGTYYNLFSVEELLDAVENRHESIEVVITGRKADPELIRRADLVTEMMQIKHYYTEGVQARPGIEK
ncbi:MAG: cob(I)yrinic acid a,c-diamide adenosyltransferase [Desulfobacteraceae bacterium]|nr:cob(I)yrinic acid a,c-diamide adenosyltransferase [Desulfobacteraceae bacterium]MBC2756233.1 cob(I)yrinic acid a,c-diamide adenosyltransferase [Desulfobacteraceae bacterium]